MTEESVWTSLLMIAGMLVVFEVWHRIAMMGPRGRMRFRKRIKCFFGKHEPGTAFDRVGGRRVQECDWCGKVVREYQVTKGQLSQEETIRRIR